MALYNPFRDFQFFDVFNSLFADFVLAFAFFTALIYAILGKRFGQQRPAVTMSATLGLALSVGLVWWEREKGWSVRSLGPVALGFAVILLGMLMYQAIRQVGGSWAGAGIAIGASLLVAGALDTPWPVARGIVQSLTTIALVIGVVAFLVRMRGRAVQGGGPELKADRAQLADLRHDMTDLYRDRQVGGFVRKQLRRVRKGIGKGPGGRQKAAPDTMRKLQQLLPAEGWLTQRLARLREKAFYARKGQVVRIQELRASLEKLPPEARQKASRELSERYEALKLDERLERLDRIAAELEKRVREVNRQAQVALQAGDLAQLDALLKTAEDLQKHGEQLMKNIQRTEKNLALLTRDVAKQAR